VDRLQELRNITEDQSLKEELDVCLQQTTPLLKVLNEAQKDTSTWLAIVSQYDAVVARLDELGHGATAQILENRRPMLENDVVRLNKWLSDSTANMDFDNISTWLESLKVKSDVEKLYSSRQFSSVASSDLPFKLSAFKTHVLDKIAVTEAAVERLFSRHKQIHTPLRARLGNDVAVDCLFVRINRAALDEEVNQLDETEPLFD